MNIMFGLVTLILIIAVVATLLLTGKSDENYSSSAKKNTMNLSLIYIVIIFLAIISLGIYIWLT
jgi:CHASE3 domain sensor protein